MKKLLHIFVLTLIIATSIGAVHAQNARTGDYYDPFEIVNRGVFAFNGYVDLYLLDPATDGYRYVVPAQGRKVVKNFLQNLREPLNAGNNLLQGDWDGVYNSTFRFITNTLAGFGGLLDVAGREGYIYEFESLGQTLNFYGVSSGPYIVLPIIGPASATDHLGLLAETYVDPYNRWTDNIDEDDLFFFRQAGEGLVIKDNFVDIQRDLRKNSADYYAATRNILYQRSQALLDEGTGITNKAPEIPVYEDDNF